MEWWALNVIITTLHIVLVAGATLFIIGMEAIEGRRKW